MQKVKTFLTFVFIILFCVTTAYAKLSSEDAKRLRTMLASKNQQDVYAAVVEIKSLGERYEYFLIRLRQLLTEDFPDKFLVAETLYALKDDAGYKFIMGTLKNEQLPSLERLKALQSLNNLGTDISDILTEFIQGSDLSLQNEALKIAVEKHLKIDKKLILTIYNKSSYGGKGMLLKALAPNCADYQEIFKEALTSSIRSLATIAFEELIRLENNTGMTTISESLSDIKIVDIQRLAEIALLDKQGRQPVGMLAYYEKANFAAKQQLILRLKALELQKKTYSFKGIYDLLRVKEKDPFLLDIINTPADKTEFGSRAPEK